MKFLVLLPLAIATTFGASLAAAADSSAAILGKWRGTYTWLQGQTGLLLTIERAAGDTLKGEFAFFSVADNPRAPDGRFAIDVVFNPRSGDVEFDAVDWIDRPNRYEMVNLSGRLSDDGRSIDGKVEFSGCTSFHVTREGGAARSTKPKGTSK